MSLTLIESGCRNTISIFSSSAAFSAEFTYRSDHAEGRDLHEAFIALGKYLEATK